MHQPPCPDVYLSHPEATARALWRARVAITDLHPWSEAHREALEALARVAWRVEQARHRSPYGAHRTQQED